MEKDDTATPYDFQAWVEENRPDVDILLELDVSASPLSSRRIKARKVIRRDPFLSVAPDTDDYILETD